VLTLNGDEDHIVRDAKQISMKRRKKIDSGKHAVARGLQNTGT
jgi:hypothetical protein